MMHLLTPGSLRVGNLRISYSIHTYVYNDSVVPNKIRECFGLVCSSVSERILLTNFVETSCTRKFGKAASKIILSNRGCVLTLHHVSGFSDTVMRKAKNISHTVPNSKHTLYHFSHDTLPLCLMSGGMMMNYSTTSSTISTTKQNKKTKKNSRVKSQITSISS